MIAAAALMAVAAAGCQTQTISTSPVTEGDDIVGVVTGPRGPEAGVWVIAETTDLPTKFYKIVVTDDQGRYAIPDLPKANYWVWTRGYGLVDGRKNRATPGSTLNLLTGRKAQPKEALQVSPSPCTSPSGHRRADRRLRPAAQARARPMDSSGR
jgi:hypothetical protein